MLNIISNMDTTEKTISTIGAIIAVVGLALLLGCFKSKKRFVVLGSFGICMLVIGFMACSLMHSTSSSRLSALKNVPESVQERAETREALMTELENGLTPQLSYKIAKYNDDVTAYKDIWYDRTPECDWDAVQPIEIYINHTTGPMPKVEPPDINTENN